MKNTATLLSAALLSGGQALAQGPCPSLPANYISQFTSVMPSTQPQDLRIPATHTFQLLVQGGAPYSTAADGAVKESFDFTGYVPVGTSSTNGYLSINHEGSSAATSGVSMLALNFNAGTKLWNVTAKDPVNFGAVVGTYNNCSGGVTPWRTVVTCEENTPTAPTDSNGDGYLDFGWNVEIDPATHTVKDQNGDGTPDKLWRMGRIKHENVVVAADQRTVYEGADEGANSFVYKYVATTAGQLANGTLYVLKMDGALGTATTGTWLPVPNSTPAECNTTTATALALGATNFNGVEDVEISPLTGQIYFTAKGPGTTYRFTDSGTTGTTISGFEIFVGNTPAYTPGTGVLRTYPINYGTGTINEDWGTGNDNLTFDSQGNLYVLQDGGRNHVWMVKPCHTQTVPAVEIFAVTPAGCEPTGMTFSPDEQFLFISMQNPSSTNALATTDAAGQAVVFNKSSAIVIGRKGTLGTSVATSNSKAELARADVYPNPVEGAELTIALTHSRKEGATLQVFNAIGGRVSQQSVVLNAGVNNLQVPVGKLRSGHYNLVVKTATTTTTRPFIKQ
ncbi:alkaline phosphatase PhoX [Hymenobacter terrenus]|uniref:alkaline phosphatase PhoX n=1 Tax=Hymenobacter terrenus TaxID=1629124 RepID=UPI0006990B10|nr:alkaline phosphatase PhoX [Hymenobacter terrenus]